MTQVSGAVATTSADRVKQITRLRASARRNLTRARGDAELLRETRGIARMTRHQRPVAGAEPHHRLQTLLEHAATRVPFYQDRVGVESRELAAFPITSRADLRESFADLIARDPSSHELPTAPLWIFRTSGSTGRPVSHIRDADKEAVWDGVAFARLLVEVGAPLEGDLFDLGLHAPSDDPVLDVVLLPPFALLWWKFTGPRSESKRQEALAIASRVEPAVVIGLPSRILSFARIYEELPVRPRAHVVLTSYEQLSEATREQLATIFGCPVFAYYATGEQGLLAWECARRRYHFDPEFSVLEVLAPDGRPAVPGDVGRVVITSLSSVVMPLIRYDTGDLARVPGGECGCGSLSPSIAALEGRSAVVVRATSGRQITAYRLLQLVDGLGVREYQVIQRVPGAVDIIVPTDARVSAELRQLVQTRIDTWLGEPVAMTIVPSGEYVLTPSGKRNPLVSEVPADADLDC
jgi:phenylacetate-coenzyme A ligase PaaK-like adenylate-forming protein